MNSLLKIESVDDRITVSARELHQVLEIGTSFKDWFPRMIEYGFNEGVDFNPLKIERLQTEGNREVMREVMDFQISIEMAKEISMIQRNSKGKEVRQYFIEVEKEWNSPEKVIARGLLFAKKAIEIKDKQIKEMLPLADYAKDVLTSEDTVVTTQIAKDYGMGAPSFNSLLHMVGIQHKVNKQWVLYYKYQDKGYVKSETINIPRKNGNNKSVMETKWTQKGRRFIYEKLKEVGRLPISEREGAS